MGRSLLQRGCPIKPIAVGLVALVALVLPCATFAAGVGGQGGAYLQLPVGAAATALGGAYSATPDYYAAWWNPAVLANLRDSRAAAGTAIRSLGRTDAYGSLEFRVPPRVGVGLFMLYRGDPSLDNLHDAQENLYPSASYTTLTFKGAVSYYATRKISIGACFNVFYQSLPFDDGSGVITNTTATGTGSFDIAAVYRANPGVWTLALVLKNLGARMNWNLGFNGLPNEDPFLSSLTLGSSLLTSLGGKPLLWNFDCRSYLYGDSLRSRNQAEVDINTGAEWRRWENFFLRAGINSIPLSSDLFHHDGLYSKEFNPRATLGFAYNLARVVHKKMWFNYAAATDGIWAGLDQQFDVTLSF